MEQVFKFKKLKFVFISLSIIFFAFILGRVLFCVIADIELQLKNHLSFKVLRLDLACSSYILFILFAINTLIKSNKTRLRVNNRFYSTIIFIILFTDIVSGYLFKEWGELLDNKAIGYLMHSDGIKTLLDNFSLTRIFIVLVLFISTNYIAKTIPDDYKFYSSKISFYTFIPLTILLLVFARGGIQKIPINSGSVYINQPLEQNLVRVNRLYYLVQSLIKFNSSSFKGKEYKDSAYQTDNSCIIDSIITSNKSQSPNVFFIVMEGVSKDLIYPQNRPEGLKSLPFLEKIRDNSIAFENIYSSGFRTDQGLLGIYSGLPSIAEFNVMKEVRSIDKKPSLFKSLNQAGFINSFFYGGDLTFSEMSRYLSNQNIQYLLGKESFDDFEQEDKLEWGLKEAYVLNKIANHIDTIREPFFLSFLTSSTHPPFDIVKDKKNELNDAEKYVESVKILDQELSKFFESINDREWYKNTLFVIVSDHGTGYLGNRGYDDHYRWKVPLFFYGEIINKTLVPSTIKTYGNHYDIPETIESILGVNSELRYRFSRNLFCENHDDFGYWTSTHIYGIVDKDGAQNFDKTNNESNQGGKFNKIEVLNQALKYELFGK